MNTVKEIAYAKVNLFLDIVKKREDGFHEICTMMHPITLFDEVAVSIEEAKQTQICMRVDGGVHVPTDERNLAFRAAKIYLEYIGKNASVEIRLRKNIPVAAGLAGGSADAAATLRAMNRLFKKALTQKTLLALAATLGSDVPFCLSGISAICEGRGEIMVPFEMHRRLYFVVAVGNEYVSTPKAYGALDALYHDFDGTVPFGSEEALARLSEYLSGKSEHIPELYNIFEAAVLPICPQAQQIRKRMKELSAVAALMSGSGPSVFGIFKCASDASAAQAALAAEGYRAFAAASV